MENGAPRACPRLGRARESADVVVSNATRRGRTATSSPPSTALVDRRRLERSRYSMSLFVWYFGTKRKYDDVAHHSILLGPALQGSSSTTSSSARCSPTTSRYLHRPTATDPSMAPEAATPSTCSPVPTSTRASTEPESGDVPPLDRALPLAHRDARPREPGRRLPRPHAPIQGFQDDLLSGAAFGMEPVLTSRPTSARTTRRGRRRALPRRRRHAPGRGDAGRALVGARARLAGPRCSSLTPRSRLDDDIARCPRSCARVEELHAASLLLPARVRAPASVVYAFCRVSDDAVDLVSPAPGPRGPRPPPPTSASTARTAAPTTTRRPRLAAVVAIHGRPEGDPRGAAGGLRVGRRGPLVRRPLGRPRVLRAGGLRGGRDDDCAHGRREAGSRRACDLGGHAAHQHRARRGKDARNGRVYLLPRGSARRASMSRRGAKPTFTPPSAR